MTSTILFALLLASSTLSGCSIGYVAEGALQQGKILWAREDIVEVVKEGKVSKDEADKLTFILEARAFAEEIGLNPRGSYKTFSPLNREALSWVVLGAKRDSFTLNTWWFPIVGTVPYKGYFEKADAEAEAKKLEALDFETWVRPTDAFSTLGWFNDPVITPMLKRTKPSLVNLVCHESLHATVWFPDQVAFNESLANFVGNESMRLFFNKRLSSCSSDECRGQEQKYVGEAEQEIKLDVRLSQNLELLYNELEKLYTSDISSEEKIAQRGEVFDRMIAPLRAQYPRMNILQSVNNAELMQLRIYFTGLEKFQNFFEKCDGDLSRFVKAMDHLKKEFSDEDPFVLLEKTC